MIRAVDTSVLVAAFASWHKDHQIAAEALKGTPQVVAHCIIETYSVLSRLPEPMRADPALVAAFLDHNFRKPPLTLDATRLRALPGQFAELGISGGASYDALIALTAVHVGATLVSLDRRAEGTYQRCGVRFEMVGVQK